MQAAPIPLDDDRRLKELYSYEILDTATEQALDELVQSAAARCGTAFGALSLVDRDRQWFKAQCGFSLAQTMRSHSVCGHGILTRAFFEVPDTQADARFKENPLLETLGVRFYGGTQLIGAQGQVLGMLCVLDPEPQTLSPAQQSFLTSLAIRAMELLEAHRQRRRLEWLGALVSQVQDEIYLFDLHTHVLLHANEAASQNGAADLSGMGLEDVTPALAEKDLAAYLRLLEDGAPEVSYSTWINRSGARVQVEARWQRLKSSAHALVMCTLRDITRRCTDPCQFLNCNSPQSANTFRI